MSRPLLLLALSGLLALASWTVQEPDADRGAEKEARRLQKALDQRAQDTERHAKALVEHLAEVGPRAWMLEHAAVLELERQRTGTMFLGFKHDSLVTWTGHPPEPLAALLVDTARAQRDLPNGIHQYVAVEDGPYRLLALTPVWLTPAIENRYLLRTLHPSWDAPA
ncbi:MAG: hypothetical protein ACO1NQ_13210, partial [Flavobacteriales bacterium]